MIELYDDEWMVLAGLVRSVVHADEEITPAELDALAKLQALAGAARWNGAVRAARRRLPTRDLLHRHARTRVRPEAQPVLYELLVELAGVDGIVGTEAEVLRRLAEAWHLRGAD